jgi:uncharacterized protein with FMN-binding domain
MKKIMAIGIVLTLSLVAIWAYLRPRFIAYDQVSKMTINQIDHSELDDGKYSGAFEYESRKIRVEVEIKDQSISNINILERDKGSHTTMAAEQIPNKIIRQQNNSIDAISGATTSSKAILKAIENALDN